MRGLSLFALVLTATASAGSLQAQPGLQWEAAAPINPASPISCADNSVRELTQNSSQFAITILEKRFSENSIRIKFRIYNLDSYEKTVSVFIDTPHATVSGSRIYAGGRVIMMTSAELAGQQLRFGRSIKAVVPPGIALDGELRADGVSIDAKDVQMFELAIADGSSLPKEKLRFRFNN